MIHNAPPKFTFGRVLATPGALAAIRASGQSELEFLNSTCSRRLGQRAVG